MKWVVLTIALIASGCRLDEVSSERVRVGDLELDAPAGWQMQAPADACRIWMPAENGRRESVAVVVGPAYDETLDEAVATTRLALGELASLHIRNETRVLSDGGLSGLRFDLDFRPDVSPATYYRSHVVLIASGHVVHVFYTARTPDPGLAMLARVVNSIQKGG